MTYIQHQVDALRQEIEKNAAENNEFKNLLKKKKNNRGKNSKETKQKHFMKKLPSLKKKINVLKMRSETNKQ